MFNVFYFILDLYVYKNNVCIHIACTLISNFFTKKRKEKKRKWKSVIISLWTMNLPNKHNLILWFQERMQKKLTKRYIEF